MNGQIKSIDPALAAAIVAAQHEAQALTRDGNSSQHGKYTTADGITMAARELLTKHGAAWVRLEVSLESCALAVSEIGKNAYVGDLIESWAIVHKGGGVLFGSSRMPVVTSMGRPHDKAVGASLTYDAGHTLRGALCLDREDKHAVDRRDDKANDRPQPQARPLPASAPSRPSVKAIDQVDADVKLYASANGLEIGKAWAEICGSLGLKVEGSRKNGPAGCTPDELAKISAWLKIELAKAVQP